MVVPLFLMGGNLLGICLYSKNKKKLKKQRLHALMGSGSQLLAASGNDIGNVNNITETEPKKEKTREEKEVMCCLNSNIDSVALLEPLTLIWSMPPPPKERQESSPRIHGLTK